VAVHAALDRHGPMAVAMTVGFRDDGWGAEPITASPEGASKTKPVSNIANIRLFRLYFLP
jgi:hypothetical protein